MPKISLAEDLEIYYLERNPTGKQTVLLLHGLGASSNSWQLQIPALEQAGFRLLAPDIRGFGRSSHSKIRMSISAMAGDLSALMDCLEIRSAHVVGISMGGILALQLVLDYTDRVDKLVLINTFAKLRPRSPKTWLYFAWRFLLVYLVGFPSQARTVTKRIFPKPDQEALRQELYREIMQSDPSAYRSVMAALARFDVSKRLCEIQAPTLILTGESDTTVPPKDQAALLVGIHSARQICVPDAGHAMIAEQPEIFNHLLLDFLLEPNPG